MTQEVHPILIGYVAVFDKDEYMYFLVERYNMAMEDALIDVGVEGVLRMSNTPTIRRELVVPKPECNWYGVVSAINNNELHTQLKQFGYHGNDPRTIGLEMAKYTFPQMLGFKTHGFSLRHLNVNRMCEGRLK